MALDTLRQDLRIAVRNLVRSPAFAIVTILTVALGIGANTAIFTVVNAVILRPLGYSEPDQLTFLTTRFPNMGFDQFWVSPPEFMEFRELNQSFSEVGAFTTGEINLTAGDRPARVRSASVSDDLLRALGVQPIQGRLFAKGGPTSSVVPLSFLVSRRRRRRAWRFCRTNCGARRSAASQWSGRWSKSTASAARSSACSIAART